MPLSPNRTRPHILSRKGFTLMELLVVMAIIGVLAGIFFGLGKGVFEQASNSKAKAELRVIANALEEFKKRHYDYPWNLDLPDDGISLSEALLGLRDAVGNEIEDTAIVGQGLSIRERDGKELILDPWDNPYIYMYDEPMNVDGSGGNWENASFILFSKGADGQYDDTGIDKNGAFDIISHMEDEDNTDNIILGAEGF